MLGDVLWVLAVIAFWAFVALLMFTFVRLISRGRDNEETVCDVPKEYASVPPSDDRLAAT